MKKIELVTLDTLRKRERELTFNKINNMFNIDYSLKDSNKSLRN